MTKDSKIPIPYTLLGWSGGKESCLAYYRLSQQGQKNIILFNFVSDRNLLNHHFIRPELIETQVDALGVKLFTMTAVEDSIQETRKLTYLKQGLESRYPITKLVFGDFDYPSHKEARLIQSREVGLDLVLPLWGMDRQEIWDEFFSLGFEGYIITGDAQFLTKEIVGRKLTPQLVKMLSKIKTIDSCGEKGEFHTFVTAGPIFKNKLEIVASEVVLDEGDTWVLDIKDITVQKGRSKVL